MNITIVCNGCKKELNTKSIYFTDESCNYLNINIEPCKDCQKSYEENMLDAKQRAMEAVRKACWVCVDGKAPNPFPSEPREIDCVVCGRFIVAIEAAFEPKCETCGGSRMVEVFDEDHGEQQSHDEPCPDCGGKGKQ